MLAAFDARDVAIIVLRVLHIGAAMVAGGGVAFQLLALHPTLRSLTDEVRVEVREKIIARWFQVVMICIGLLLITGLVNFAAFRVPEMRGKPYAGLYHALFGVKVLLALGVFHTASILVVPRPRGEKYRARAGMWLTCLAIGFSAILIIAAVMNTLRAAALQSSA